MIIDRASTNNSETIDLYTTNCSAAITYTANTLPKVSEMLS